MFERYSQRARQVIVLAQQEARELGHGYIGTEHLLIAVLHPEVDPEHVLLALLAEGEGVAARILVDAGADRAAIRASLVGVYVDRPDVPAIAPPVEILPELDVELGWRGRPIALAALGAAVLARSAFGTTSSWPSSRCSARGSSYPTRSTRTVWRSRPRERPGWSSGCAGPCPCSAAGPRPSRASMTCDRVCART